MVNIDMNSMVKINGGKSLNMVEFADKLGLDILNPTVVISTANLLQRRGQLTVVENKSKEEKLLDSAVGEYAFQEAVNNIAREEEAHKTDVRNQKKADTDTHTIKLSFTTTLEATKFETWVNNLGVDETSQIIKGGAIKLLIENITPNEYVKITTKYKAELAINKTVNTTSKLINGTTNGINYGMSEVVAPVAKIAGEAGMNLTKGLFHTGMKTLAGLVNSGAKAIDDTKMALISDPDCLRATSQLIDAKNTIKRGVNSKLNSKGFGSGIEIL